MNIHPPQKQRWGWIASRVVCNVVGLFLISSWVIGCQSNANSSPLFYATPVNKTAPSLETNSLIPTPNPPASISETPLATPVSTPANRFPIPQGIAFPLPAVAISPENALDVMQLARWGRGIQFQVAWSPDSSLLASATAIGISLYDPNSMEKVREIAAPAMVRSISFEPNGTLLAGGLSDGTIRLWRISDGSMIRTLIGHIGIVNTVAFSPDGKLLVSGSSDHTVRVWNIADGTLIFNLAGHSDSVNSVAFSPDGTLLASGSDDGNILLWRISDGAQIRNFGENMPPLSMGEKRAIKSIAFSPDGTLLAGAGTPYERLLWKVSTGELATPPCYPTDCSYSINTLAFSKDGALLAFGSDDGSITFYNLNNLQEPLSANSEMTADWGAIRSLAFSPDGTRLAVGTTSVTTLLRLSDRAWLNSPVEGWNAVDRIAFSMDRKLLAVGPSGLGIQLLQVEDGKQLQTLGFGPGDIDFISFSPDGSKLASGTWEEIEWVGLFGAGDYGELASEGRGMISSSAISPDWKFFAFADYFQNLLCIGTILKPFPNQCDIIPKYVINTLAFSPDGKMLVSGSNDSMIRIWRTSNGMRLAELKGHSDSVNSVAFSPDGRIIASGSSDKTIRLWRAADGEMLFTLSGKTGVRSVVFSADGAILASGMEDGTICLWDVANGNLLVTLSGHMDSVKSVTFSPDGLLLASGSADGTVRIWGITS